MVVGVLHMIILQVLSRRVVLGNQRVDRFMLRYQNDIVARNEQRTIRDVMAEVMAMGFSTEQAKQALQDSDGSVDMAVSMLQTRFTKAAESAALRRGREGGGGAGTLTHSMKA